MEQTPRPDCDMFDTVSQLEIFPTDLQIRRVDPARNMRRFYRVQMARSCKFGHLKEQMRYECRVSLTARGTWRRFRR
jgi:hypothetical protein